MTAKTQKQKPEGLPRWVAAAQDAGARVLSAWLTDEAFRKAYQPEADLFVGQTQSTIATLAALLGPALDPDVLLYELSQRGLLEKAGGLEAVEALAWATPASVDPWQHVAALREAAAGRRLKADLAALLAELDQGALDFAAAEARAAEALRAARATGSRERMLSMRDLFHAAHERMLKAPKKSRISTGMLVIDNATGGIAPETCWLMAAETNWGKTSFLCLLVLLALARGLRPGIVTGEDSPELMGRRLLAARAEVSATRLRDRKLDRLEHKRILAEVQRAEGAQMVLDARRMPIERVASEIQSATRSEGIDLWLLDYVQVFDSAQAYETEVVRIGRVARRFTDAVKIAGVAGVAFSQITPDGSKPNKYSARGNKDLANAAECILVGYKEKTDERDEAGQVIERRMILLDKNKDGPCPVTTEIEWDRKSACFRADRDVWAPAQQELGAA